MSGSSLLRTFRTTVSAGVYDSSIGFDFWYSIDTTDFTLSVARDRKCLRTKKGLQVEPNT